MNNYKKKISKLLVSECKCTAVFGDGKDVLKIADYFLHPNDEKYDVEVSVPTDQPGMCGYVIQAINKNNSTDVRYLASDHKGNISFVKVTEISLIVAGMRDSFICNFRDSLDALFCLNVLKKNTSLENFDLKVQLTQIVGENYA